MRILQVEPSRPPEVRDIDNSLEAMQAVVGGLIQVLFPFDGPVALIANDEGKLLHLPANRALRDGQGRPYDILCGTFFLCGAPADCGHFVSLTNGQIEKYRALFQHPEMFIRMGGQIIVLPCG